ncbi:MAG: FGGY-family carbohydrate kinase [Cyanobacteriota bacterium]|nr:FGGY-family carbohydrate kinase [Cyanobacteriota bacterium]
MDAAGTLLAEAASSYPGPFDNPWGWRQGLIALVGGLNSELRAQVGAIALDGTSGTLLLCRPDGTPAPGELGQALPYALACPEQAAAAAALVADCPGSPAASASGSLARALRLLEAAARAGLGSGHWLLRHQADWLMGWLLGDWRWGEEGNNLRLGWQLEQQRWAGTIEQQSWAAALPQITASGSLLGPLQPAAAEALGLPPHCRVVAGTTDANAGVLAADPSPGDGITVLGTTLVLKQFCPRPLQGPGISCHRVAGRWLVGGASNAGAGVLRLFFSDGQLEELSRQIDPRQPSGLSLRPLPAAGERFPVDDPELEPVLTPRPVSDSLFLQGLLEGLAAIEAAGWQRLRALGAPPVRRVISLGGGARNPQWRAIRQRLLGVPVLNRPQLSAARGMARLAATALPPP